MIFTIKIRADNAIKHWALAFDPRCRRMKLFIDKHNYSKANEEKKKRDVQMNVSKGDRTFSFFFLAFFFSMAGNKSTAKTRLYRSRFSIFFEYFQLIAKEQKAGMMIV